MSTADRFYSQHRVWGEFSQSRARYQIESARTADTKNIGPPPLLGLMVATIRQ